VGDIIHAGTIHSLPEPPGHGSILTLAEAAKQLRCSKAHLCNVINGKVPHVPSLPVLRIGRRVLIRQDALALWVVSLEDLRRQDLGVRVR